MGAEPGQCYLQAVMLRKHTKGEDGHSSMMMYTSSVIVEHWRRRVGNWQPHMRRARWAHPNGALANVLADLLGINVEVEDNIAEMHVREVPGVMCEDAEKRTYAHSKSSKSKL